MYLLRVGTRGRKIGQIQRGVGGAAAAARASTAAGATHLSPDKNLQAGYRTRLHQPGDRRQLAVRAQNAEKGK